MTNTNTANAAADLRDTLINIAREIEALKRECGMDPESPIAIQNGRYMALSYKVRALAAGQATAAQQRVAYAELPDALEALQLKSCPCGATPTALQITGDEQAKWAHVSGNCCGEWEIEYRNNYTKLASTEAMTLAAAAWNEAPRASHGQAPAQQAPQQEVVNDLPGTRGLSAAGQAAIAVQGEKE